MKGACPPNKNGIRLFRTALNTIFVLLSLHQMKTRIYHNPRCSKSRETLALLKEANEDIEIIEYLNEIPSKSELKTILTQLGIKPEQLLRKAEPVFKEHFKGKTLTDEEWINAMVTYPKLIERPIVIKDGKAALGRPPSQVLDIL